MITTHPEELLAFSEQNGVTHIYLYIDRKNVAPEEYSRFIQEASKREIQVEALGGDPSWGLKEKRQYLQEFIEWVASYNTSVDEDARFRGIHLDIEPYLLPAWETDQERVVEEWLSNMEFAVNQARWLGGYHVSADVPFWIHQIGVPGYENNDAGRWMLQRFDTLVLMDYRDRAAGSNGIISNGIDMVAEASSLNTSVVIGVEMAPSSESGATTFYEEGTEVMERELDMTRRYFEPYSGFQGVAVHGFTEWMSADQKGE